MITADPCAAARHRSVGSGTECFEIMALRDRKPRSLPRSAFCRSAAGGRSKFSEAQIAFILRQAEEETPVGEVCRKAGISEATYYNWRRNR
jgi:putative transposase